MIVSLRNNHRAFFGVAPFYMTGISDLMNVRYWLTPNPGVVSDQTALFFVVLFGFFILLKVLFRYMGRQYIDSLTRHHKRFMYRLEKMFLTMGILGLFWLFFAYETIPFFSGRFWFILWGVGAAVWAYYIFYYVRFEIPQLLYKYKELEYARKYMPKIGRL